MTTLPQSDDTKPATNTSSMTGPPTRIRDGDLCRPAVQPIIVVDKRI